MTTKYHHNFTAFVERFNKTLAERLFKPQDAQELQNPTKDSKQNLGEISSKDHTKIKQRKNTDARHAP